MCNIAGYIGEKRAAPLLIEMMLREEGFDAGYYTGISTIHEGKLYYAKLTGDTKRLVDLTAAAELPGNIGLIHGRTRSGGGDEWAHPFIAERDGEPYLAYVANGSSGCFSSRQPELVPIAERLLSEGYRMHSRAVMPTKKYFTFADGTSVHSSDATAQLVMCNMDHGQKLHEAMENALCTILSEDVALAISLDDPTAIGFTRINQPMVVAFADHGVYMASTAMAFPEDVGEVKPIPILSSGYVYRDRICTFPYKVPPCAVKDADPATTARIYAFVVEQLKKERHTLNSLRNLVNPLFGECQSAVASYLLYEILRSLKNEDTLQCETVTVDGIVEGLTAPQIRMWI